MKKKQIAFTLIELLVVITVISIISISSINWFFNFLQEKDANMKIMEFSFYVDSLDKKVKDRNFFDYQIEINNSTLLDSYIVYKDYFDTEKSQIINYDLISDTAEIVVLWWWSDQWRLRIYKDHKLKLNSDTSTPYSESLDKNYNYRFISYLSWSTEKTNLNDIEFKRFDKNESEMTLLRISETESWPDIWNLIIRNIWWKKEYLNSWNSLDQVFLYFENKWAESFIKLTK